MFHTPENHEELNEWIGQFPPQDRITLFTAAGMAMNMCSVIVGGQIEEFFGTEDEQSLSANHARMALHVASLRNTLEEVEKQLKELVDYDYVEEDRIKILENLSKKAADARQEEVPSLKESLERVAPPYMTDDLIQLPTPAMAFLNKALQGEEGFDSDLWCIEVSNPKDPDFYNVYVDGEQEEVWACEKVLKEHGCESHSYRIDQEKLLPSELPRIVDHNTLKDLLSDQ